MGLMALFGVTANVAALTTLVSGATKRGRVSKPTILFIILCGTGELEVELFMQTILAVHVCSIKYCY